MTARTFLSSDRISLYLKNAQLTILYLTKGSCYSEISRPGTVTLVKGSAQITKYLKYQ